MGSGGLFPPQKIHLKCKCLKKIGFLPFLGSELFCHGGHGNKKCKGGNVNNPFVSTYLKKNIPNQIEHKTKYIFKIYPS